MTSEMLASIGIILAAIVSIWQFWPHLSNRNRILVVGSFALLLVLLAFFLNIFQTGDSGNNQKTFHHIEQKDYLLNIKNCKRIDHPRVNLRCKMKFINKYKGQLGFSAGDMPSKYVTELTIMDQEGFIYTGAISDDQKSKHLPLGSLDINIPSSSTKDLWIFFDYPIQYETIHSLRMRYYVWSTPTRDPKLKSVSRTASDLFIENN